MTPIQITPEIRAKSRAYRDGRLMQAQFPVDITVDPRLTYNAVDGPEILNLGSGVNPIPAAVNVDVQNFPGVDLTFDFTQFPWPIADHAYDKVTLFHCLEHVPPLVALDVLKEARRVMRDLGHLIVEVPDIYRMCQNVVNGDYGMLIGALYGGHDAPQDAHRFGYTESSLALLCHLAGFPRVVTKPGTDYHAVQMPTLRVEAVKLPHRDTVVLPT
jgi:predicted SAM-dependent methyltransferase